MSLISSDRNGYGLSELKKASYTHSFGAELTYYSRIKKFSIRVPLLKMEYLVGFPFCNEASIMHLSSV
jgi:hypothetical protein